MTQLLLVNPPLSMEQRYAGSAKYGGHTFPPLGLCHLAAVAREQGYDVAILDAIALALTHEETVAEILRHDPAWLGLYSVTLNIHRVAALAQAIKEQAKDITIIVGGPHITAVPERSMELFPQFDVGVIGEGEVTLMELLKALQDDSDLRSVQGLVLRHSGTVGRTPTRQYIRNLDQLPIPAWDLLPDLATHYRPSPLTIRRLPAGALVTSRGCPYDCIFCDRSLWGRVWRGFSPEYVVRLLEILNLDYGLKDINITDDHFTVNKKRLRRICELLIKKRLDLVWSTVGRADAADPESLRLMREAGCWQIAYGIETGSPEILAFLRKGETLDLLEGGVRLTKEAGITVKGLFMIGCPMETRDTIRQTMEFIQKLELDYVSMAAFTPLPNTEIYEVARQYGTFDDNWQKMSLWEPIFIPFGLTREYLEQFIQRKTVDKETQCNP